MPSTYFVPDYLRNSAYAAECESCLARGLPIEEPLPNLLARNKEVPQVLKISEDQQEVMFVGPAKNSDSDAASVRTNHPIPPSTGLFYFECTIVSKGREGFIGIGFCRSGVLLTRLPGWEADSWGYHGDDGHSFCSQGTGKDYGPRFTTNDIIGCAINFGTGECFYTKNGMHLGIAFTGLHGKLYPSIGLRTLHEHVRVNFGQEPFVFDIDHWYRAEKQKMYKKVSDSVEDAATRARALVSDYLSHNGFVESARVMAKDVAVQTGGAVDYPAIDTEASYRQQVRNSIVEGDIDAALATLEDKWRPVLEKDQELLFKLRCQKFLEMVRRASVSPQLATSGTEIAGNGRAEADVAMSDAGAADDEHTLADAIDYGRTLQGQYPESTHASALREIFSVLAYDDPHESPLAELLHDDGRTRLAELVNGAILTASGRNAKSELELIVATLLQGIRVREPGTAFINVVRDHLTEDAELSMSMSMAQ